MNKQIDPKVSKPLRRILAGAVLIFVLSLFRHFPAFVEVVYSRSLFPLISGLQHLLFNFIAFSVGDIFYFCLIIFLLAGVIAMIRLLVLQRWRLSGFYILRILFLFEIAICVFYIFWGLNYFRYPAAIRFELPAKPVTTRDVKSVLNLLIDSVNENRAKLSERDFDISDDSLFRAAKLEMDGSSIASSQIRMRIKPSLISGLMNYTATAGYYNPFTGEAQINKDMPVFLKPFVCLHELSHQTGIGAEDEANFTGFITGTTSKNAFTRYSAYYLATQEFLVELKRRDSSEFSRYKEKLSPAVLNDFDVERQYWLKYRGRLERITGAFYDKFLKANNQPQGLKTYNRMIYLTMAWYRKNHKF